MSRQKGTPNKRTKELVTEFGNIGVVGGKDICENLPVYVLTNKQEKKSEYIVCEGFNPSDLCIQVMDAKNHGYHCVGGIAIHDIRNPVTNEYEPHYYQAMEKVDN